MASLRYVFIFFCLLWVCPSAARAGELIELETSSTQETITISALKLSPHKVFTLPSPDRLVVDIPVITPRPVVVLPEGYKGKNITNIRIGQFDPKTLRIVFDLAQPIKVQKINESKEDSGGLVIEIVPADSAAAPTAEEKPPEKQIETREKPAEKIIENPVKPVVKNVAAIAKPQKPKKPVPQKPIIVIDAGHGGQDPGTSGPDGNDEKDVVLEYAKALKAKLLKTGRYQVVLTREDDMFIMLRKRVEIARKAGATLFISLHADSAPDDSARGLSVYTVSEKASDAESEKLAARENKADVLSTVDLSDESRDVADILISLAERDTKNRSATLADVLVTSLDDKVHLLSNTHRFAGFAVLKAPDVPSVLIEIGFLSQPNEEKMLVSKSYRDKVTSGIAAGVDQYFAVEKRVGEP